MALCRVCGQQYTGEKWYSDDNIQLMRRSCCDGIPPNEIKRQEWIDELKEIDKRTKILENALKCMSPKIVKKSDKVV